jgi:hypothetical protein
LAKTNETPHDDVGLLKSYGIRNTSSLPSLAQHTSAIGLGRNAFHREAVSFGGSGALKQ